MICAGSIFAASICFIVYLFAHERGRAKGRQEGQNEVLSTFDNDMPDLRNNEFWEMQELKKREGLSYWSMDENGRD